jgi:Protein of unknown function (DUF3365)
MKKTVLIAALTLFPLTGFAGGNHKAEDPRLPDLMKSTKEVVDPMPEKLKAVLVGEIATNGAVKAIEVCSIKAPAMARAASEKTGWDIKRVSLKNRNPKGSADKWEKRAIKGFEQELKANSDAVLEKGEIVTIKGKHYFRYAKGLKTAKECLTCHGKEENIAKEIKEKLKEVYPKDRATGYDLNQVRGIISVTRAIN